MKAIITGFLKKEAGITIYYNIGDEHPTSSYYPSIKKSYGDGLIIFFTGSPATMRRSLSYSRDRIFGLGNMPLKLFVQKFKEPNV